MSSTHMSTDTSEGERESENSKQKKNIDTMRSEQKNRQIKTAPSIRTEETNSKKEERIDQSSWFLLREDSSFI